MKSNRYKQFKNQQKESAVQIREIGTHYKVTSSQIIIYPKIKDRSISRYIDITYWRKYANLYEPFLKAMIELYRDSSHRTILTVEGNIKTGFFSYLTEVNKENIKLEDIDQPLMNGFVVWLNQLAEKKDVARWSENTRARRHGAIWTIFERIMELPEGSVLSIRRNRYQWPGRHRHSNPFQGLTSAGFEKVYRICVDEASKTMAEFYETKKILEDNEFNLKNVSSRGLIEFYTDYRNIILAFSHYWPDYDIPNSKEIIRIGGNSLYRQALPIDSVFLPKILPTNESILPFVLLLAIHFSANAESLLKAEVSDFDTLEILGVKRFRFIAKKDRSSTNPSRTHAVTDEIDNPAVIFNFLLEYTGRIRKLVSPMHQNRLFIFRNNLGVRSYHTSRAGGGGDSNWHNPLQNFIKNHTLEHFNLSMLRQSVLDRVDELFDGDIRARKVAAQHKSITVTSKHYTSASIKRMNHERLAIGMSQRTRYLESAARVDPRKHNNSKSSATPGFSCLDPFSSPFFEQREDRLCTAYGMCPNCPLATTDKNCGTSAAQSIQLRLAIEEAASFISPQRYLDIWTPIIKKLDEIWIPSFTEQAMRKAKTINLPKLPTIE